MTMTTISGYPLSLREYLDGGGSVCDFPEGIWGWFVETVVEAHDPTMLSEQIARFGDDTVDEHNAKTVRAYAELIDRAETPEQVVAMQRMRDREIAWHRWHDELLRDAELRDRVEAQLPADRIAEHQAGLEAEITPYRLVVRHLASYRCAVTGEELTGTAIVIEGTAEWVREYLDGPPEFIFSPAAVEAALRRAQMGAS